jgi:hypothetical protein
MALFSFLVRFYQQAARRKTMIRHACFVAALAATVAFAKQNEERGCESESNSDRRATNAVVFWNEVAGHSIADLGGRGPPLGSVETAVVHTAIYDAVNAICGYQFTPYEPDRSCGSESVALFSRFVRFSFQHLKGGTK